MGEGSGKSGQPDLGVGESGFGAYVKTSKPWFIGREAYIAHEQARKGVVVRFRFPEKGVRMAHNGDPLLDKRGRVIGWVTSCAADMEGTLTGQAFVELKYAVRRDSDLRLPVRARQGRSRPIRDETRRQGSPAHRSGRGQQVPEVVAGREYIIIKGWDGISHTVPM